MAKHGLVIGKFYPPHRGHHFLIRTAQSQVDRLTILVCRHDSQEISADLRAAWLREVHPEVHVQVIDDIVPDDDSHGWAEYTKQILGRSPDIVFTSEAYGDLYAHYLGCRHVQVDRARIHIPCSGTAIRADPLQHWDFLEPCVRAFFARRIALFGAESSGTTTLTQALAAYYGTTWVPEYGRDYSITRPGGTSAPWESSEFIHIATQQCKLEDAAARNANRLVFCDTPAFATSLWHERYLGALSPAVEAIAEPYHYALSFLTDADIPFEQDGTRDGEHIRHHMHERFITWLNLHNRPFILLSGPLEERLRLATAHIDPLLGGPALVLA